MSLKSHFLRAVARDQQSHPDLSADETYWLCVTRTVQESKLFPVPPT